MSSDIPNIEELKKTPNPHIRVKSLDVDEMIDNFACSRSYRNLEECLVQYDRNWSKCQEEVKLLQKCNSLRSKMPAKENTK
jgi:hypothetical protein